MIDVLIRGMQEVIAKWARLTSDVPAHPYRTLAPELVNRSLRSGSLREASLAERRTP